MSDWPGHTFDPGSTSKSGADGNEGGAEAASTLEQLKGAGGGGAESGDGDGDGLSLGAPFTDDFVGTEVRKAARKVWDFARACVRVGSYVCRYVGAAATAVW